jgi:hypothetical protein
MPSLDVNAEDRRKKDYPSRIEIKISKTYDQLLKISCGKK